MLKPETRIELINTLATWLPQAQLGDIRDYYQNLPANRSELVDELAPLLIDAAITTMSEGIGKLATTNAPRVLPEPEFIRFLTALTQYNTASVVRSFTKQAPSLQFNLIVPLDTLLKQIAEWMVLWTNTQYLITCPTLEEHELYLNSLYTSGLNLEALGQLSKDFSQIMDDLEPLFIANNFEPIVLSSELQIKMESLLKRLLFLPKEYIQSLVSQALQEDDYQKLLVLENVLFFISDPEVGKEQDRDIITTYLWEFLRNQWQKQYFLSKPNLVLSELPTDAANILLALSEAITLPVLRSGQYKTQAQSMVSTLPAEEQATYLSQLPKIFSLSPIIRGILEPLDVDAAITNLSNKNLDEQKIYINSLQPTYSDTDWPLVQATLNTVASIIPTDSR